VLAIWFGPPLLVWLLKLDDEVTVMATALRLLLLVFGPIMGIMAVLEAITAMPQTPLIFLLRVVVFLLLVGSTGWFLFLVTTIWPILMAMTVYLIMIPLEFLTRRIAEHPKGPILAASALFAGIAAVLKQLGY
jgi:hypothetical protein